MQITKIFKEFPATEQVLIDGRQEKQSIVFCLHGDSVSDSFLNLWSSFLILLSRNYNLIDTHMVNTSNSENEDGKNKIISMSDLDNNLENMVEYLWNYEYLFFINKNLNYFNPYDIFKFILQMNLNETINIISYGKKMENEISDLDMDFCIIRKNILENIEYPWFDHRDNNTNFNKKLKENNISVVYDKTCSIK